MASIPSFSPPASMTAGPGGRLGFVLVPDAPAGPPSAPYCQGFDLLTGVRCDRSLVPYRDERGLLWTPDAVLAAARAAGLLPASWVLCRTCLSRLRAWREQFPAADLPTADLGD